MEPTRRVGRPPRITAEDIVNAALQVGLEQANIRNVAEALGMSPTGLYRHVRSREHLLDLVAEQTFSTALEGAPERGSYEDYLLHHARKMFDLYASHPEAIRPITSGDIIVNPTVVAVLEKILAHGVKRGLTAAEAYDSWVSVLTAVVGAAVFEARDRSMSRAQGSFFGALEAVMQTQRAGAPQLQSLLDQYRSQSADYFETVRDVVNGLRMRYGSRFSTVKS